MGIFTSPKPAPAAPSAKRAHGEWIHAVWTCSQCGHAVPPKHPLPEQCPHCEARREFFHLVSPEADA